MNFIVYILRTSKNTLYVGQTNNLEKRLREHKEKSIKSAKYLRMFSDFTLVYKETYASRSQALKREAELKKWPKNRKESLVDSCFQCGVCCRLFSINLNEEEWKSGQFETVIKTVDTNELFTTVEQYGGNIIKEQKDGSCIYLKGDLCSIHERRPQACRDFFCASKDKKFKNMIQIIKKQRENDTIRSC